LRARNDAGRIAREKMAWADRVAWLLNAAIAGGEDRSALAPDGLARAADGFDRAEMQRYAAVTQRRLGALVKGDRGRDRCANPTSGWRLRISGTWRASRERWRPDSRTRHR
jgi:hypothetical protein